MKLLRRLLYLGLLFAAAIAGAEQPFHVYAPSHTAGKLLVASATPTANGLELTLAQEIKLDFPVSTITQHPTKPLLYLAPPSGEEGKAKGAVITLQNDGTYQRHAELLFSHPSADLSLDQTRRFLLSADYGKGFVDVYALDETGAPGKRNATVSPRAASARRNRMCVSTIIAQITATSNDRNDISQPNTRAGIT